MAASECDISVVKENYSELGEGPHWDETAQRLIWVDIFGQSVHLLDPVTGKVRVFEGAAMRSICLRCYYLCW